MIKFTATLNDTKAHYIKFEAEDLIDAEAMVERIRRQFYPLATVTTLRPLS